MKTSTYDAIRDQIQQGDVFAFGGGGFVSDAIKFFTRSPLSHVGIVLETKVSIDKQAQPGTVIMLIESTTLDGKQGVQVNRLSERVANYDGNVWFMPLAEQIRAQCDWKRFYDYALSLEGHPYAYIPVGMMMFQHIAKVPVIGRLFKNPRDSSQLFCSALDTALLEQAGAVNMDVDYAEVSPEGLAEMKLYRDVIQIKGSLTEIPRWNTDPAPMVPATITKAIETAPAQ